VPLIALIISAATLASDTLLIPMAISLAPSTGFVVWSASKKIVTAVAVEIPLLKVLRSTMSCEPATVVVIAFVRFPAVPNLSIVSVIFVLDEPCAAVTPCTPDVPTPDDA